MGFLKLVYGAGVGITAIMAYSFTWTNAERLMCVASFDEKKAQEGVLAALNYRRGTLGWNAHVTAVTVPSVFPITTAALLWPLLPLSRWSKRAFVPTLIFLTEHEAKTHHKMMDITFSKEDDRVGYIVPSCMFPTDAQSL